MKIRNKNKMLHDYFRSISRYGILLLAFLFPLLGWAQSGPTSTENYTYVKKCLDSACLKKSELVSYYDALGRSRQVVGIKETPLGRDLVVPSVYDDAGKKTRDYLPVPQAGSTGGALYQQSNSMTPFPVNDASNFYGGERTFSETTFESSPLNRPLQQLQTGNDWTSKPLQYTYGVNLPGDKIRNFKVTTTWEGGATKNIPVDVGMFSGSELQKKSMKDEDGLELLVFTNAKGQSILERKVISAGNYADTYYLYNKYGQLVFVLPPLASASQDIATNADKQNSLIYQYKYDGRGRIVEQKTPGKGWEYKAYDKSDRLVMMQDATMKPSGKWFFTKYDKLSRVIYSGFVNVGNSSRQQVQNNIYSNIDQGKPSTEERNTTGFSSSGLTVYYGNTVYPTMIDKVLSVNYYDTYPEGTPPVPTQVFSQMVSQQPGVGSLPVNTQGLSLASFVKNLDDDRWTKNYSYYDTQAREVSLVSVNYLGGYTKTDMELDFAGNPLRVNTFHKRKADETGVNIKERLVYDEKKRLKRHYHQVDDHPEELLSENTYNELSQLVNKKVGNNLQSIDYSYNIRGWLTDINKAQMSLADLGGKLFSYKVKYTQKEGITNPDGVLFPGKNVAARYNGSIAEVDWRSVETPGVYPSLTPKRYGYAYDNLGRLSAGFYQNPLNPYSKENTESMQYDLNGNITSLYRTSVMENGSGIATKIDDLVYTYNGNQAVTIKDNSSNTTGYEGVNGFPIGYDVNGNITSMPDKQITGISYNFLNLPKGIDLGFDTFGKHIETLYSADGSKLKKTSTNTVAGYNTITTTTESIDYLDGFEYHKKDITTSGGNGSGTPVFEDDLMMSRAMEPQAFTPILAEPGIDPVLGGGTIGNITLLSDKTADLQFFPTSEGYYDYQKNQYIYQYKDLLGNVRVSFGKNSAGVLEIVDSNDYYPYGMNHLKTGAAYFGQNSYKKYKFLGNELQESGIYDMNARFYMPDVGRFMMNDPLSDMTLDPYGYASGNPMLFTDASGLANDRLNGNNGPGNTEPVIGTMESPIDVGEIVLNAPISPMAFNSNLPSCSYCYTGSGVRGGLQNMGILPRPLSHEEALRRVRIPVLHNGSAQMMDSMWEVLGILAANAKPENKEAALGLAAIAIITTKGRAAPGIIKTEATGAYYSVAYEMKLAENLYPGKSGYIHFKAANTALAKAIESDSKFAVGISNLGITIPRSSKGTIKGISPANWVWHHNVDEGIMQLVPKSQHPSIPGGIFWKTMHPDGKGGMSIWGGGYKKK